jgi:hypothetical protein
MSRGGEIDMNSVEILIERYKNGEPDLEEKIRHVLNNCENVEILHYLLLEIPYLENFFYFKNELIMFANGVLFDSCDDLKIAAISGIFRLVPDPNEVKDVIWRALHESNPVVRDTAAAMVQLYNGVSVPNVDWGEGAGDVADELGLLLAWRKISGLR